MPRSPRLHATTPKRDDDEAVQPSAEREDDAGRVIPPRVPGSEQGHGHDAEFRNREGYAIELIVLDDAANHGWPVCNASMRRRPR